MSRGMMEGLGIFGQAEEEEVKPFSEDQSLKNVMAFIRSTERFVGKAQADIERAKEEGREGRGLDELERALKPIRRQVSLWSHEVVRVCSDAFDRR